MNESPSWTRVFLDDWQRRLSTLFVGLLLLQYVNWIDEEQTVWLHETVVLVKWSLLLTFLLELIPRIRLWIRLLFQFVVLLLFTLMAVGYQPVGGSIASLDDAVQLWNDNVGQLLPYVVFILGAWLIYLYSIWWVNRKWRIVALIGISVAVLAIRDSFSLLQLWDEVAITVLCGLSLLVICHFTQLKRKNPVGWIYLAEYPVSAGLPVVLIITFVMALGVLVPEIPPTLKDPYTLYKEWRGEPVPAFGKGIGIAGANGNASSGYGRNDQLLGGGFDFDYEPIMMVDTSHRAYWRGETRSFYNGKGWETTDADKQTGLSAVAAESGLQQDPRLQDSRLKYVEVTQTITMEKPDSFPVLFGAYSISKMLAMNGDNISFDRLTWSSRQQELRFQERGKVYPKTYTIVSQMPVVDESGLRTAPIEVPAGQQMDDYLQLPSSVPPRVKELAQQITAGVNNPYDKIKLLEQYLQKTYPYTNKPETSLGKSRDFVDRFLFEIKEGYCDYYSTAMAVMTRAIGIPSRWVKGYSTGTSPNANVDDVLQAELLADPNGAGLYTVRNSDAHSWVEVYFSGWGWIPFEPTSGFSMPTAELPLESEPLPALPAISLDGSTETSGPLFTAGRVTAGITVVVLAVAAAALFYFARQYNWMSLLARESHASTLNQKVVAEYNRLIRYSRRRGYPAHDHETVRETFQRWMQKDVWLSRDYEAIVSLFEKAKYSGRDVTSDDAERMTQLVKKLREEM